MNVAEARRALGEMRAGLGPTHVKEVEAKLAEAESADPNDPADPNVGTPSTPSTPSTPTP
jgi:hypothetical protein